MFILLKLIIHKSILLSKEGFKAYSKMIFTSCLTLLLFATFFPLPPLHASSLEIEKEYEWIEYLFNKERFEQTINEGLRFVYEHPTSPLSDQVRMITGKSFLKTDDIEKAIETFEGLAAGGTSTEVQQEAEMWLCNSLLQKGNYSGMRSRCDAFLARFPDSPLRDRARFHKGWSYLEEWQWAGAEDAFRSIDPNSDLFSPSQEIVKGIYELRDQKGKSPLAAGLLSLFLPGAGYVYAGRWQTGIAAFIVNGLFIGATIEAFDNDLPILGSIIGMVELGWYSGTIYGSMSGARRYNYELREEKLGSLGRTYAFPILQMEF